MSDLWKMILLAVVQGITEFLPISSSGHLTVGQEILDMPKEDNLLVTIVLHAGTLLSILIYYAKDIRQEIIDRNYKLFACVCVGTIPLVFIAFLPIKEALKTPNVLVCAVGFLITFVLLVFVLKSKNNS